MSLSNLTIGLCLAIICPFICGGCFTSSSLQSARLADPGEFEITPSYSYVNFADEKTDKVADQCGVQLGLGVSEHFNMRFRYEYIQWANRTIDGGHNFLAVEPKVGLVENVFAVSMPVGLFFGEHVEEKDSWQIHPTLLATVPVNPGLEVNGSAKYLYFFDSDTNNLVALNVGVGFGQIDNIVVRPEIGWLFDTGENGYYFHWSIGMTVYGP